MNRLNSHPRYIRELQKGHLMSMGFSYDDLDKPIVGIVNSWNEIVPGHKPLRELSDKVKEGVWAAGGLPIEFNTIAICDGIAQGHKGMNYSLPSRELIADSIEAMVKSHDIFDSLVFLSSCDKIVPGMLMAMARIDIPSIWIGAGPIKNEIKPVESKKARKQFLNGEISDQELLKITRQYYSCPGVCPFLGTANTMCIVAEVLGVGLPGSALIPAGTAERLDLANKTGKEAVTLALKGGPKPSEIFTKKAFEDSIAVVNAIGGSLNSVIHIPAIAYELGLEFSIEDFARISEKIPFIVSVTPNNNEKTVVDLHFAGGVAVILNELRSLLNLERKTVTGKSYFEVLQELSPQNLDKSIIHPISEPIRKNGGLILLKGNLAPEGAFLKVSAIEENVETFEGRAKVFNSEEEFIRFALSEVLKEGDIIVIRYEGPRGGPGMKELHRCVEILNRYKGVALITDGRLSGASYGISVAYVSPEAAAGGPIACVKNGDRIQIDLKNRALKLLISENELQERLNKLIPVDKKLETKNSYLKYYKLFTGSAAKGATRT